MADLFAPMRFIRGPEMKKFSYIIPLNGSPINLKTRLP